MENNYWDYSQLIEATEEELDKHLNYEFWMFRETCEQLNLHQSTVFERNLLLESLPTHIRVLINFFYGKKKNVNDLVVQDFLSNGVNWVEKRPAQTKLLIDAKNKADKQVAHLSRWRIKIEADNKKDWDWPGISNDIENVIKNFEEWRK